MALQNFIEKLREMIEPIEKSSRLAWWNLATTGDEKHAQEIQEANIALRKIYSSKEKCQFLIEHQNGDDPFLNRQATILLHNFQENQIPPDKIEGIVKLETEIESIYTNFRPIINNEPVSNNDLKQILADSLDSKKRQEAWEASKLIGDEVEKKVLALIHLRNESAKLAGFKNYYSMRLNLQELDEQELFNLIDDLNKLTTPHWATYKAEIDTTLSKRFDIESAELMPWHYQDPFFQEAPSQEIDFDRFYKNQDLVEISKKFYQTIGLPVEDVLNKSDLYERDKKNQHAFCTCIDKMQDIRILCNLRQDEYWMGTQLHELGHAVYDKYIDQNLPYFLREPAHTCTTEAIAMLFGRLSNNTHFLTHFCHADPLEVQKVALQSKQQNAANLLVFARWSMVMIHFEKALYENPNQDLNQTWWDLVEKFQWMKRVPNRNKPDWAAKLHLACAPVYYQNYILGEMTASQLFHYIKKGLKQEENFCRSMYVGEFLKKNLFQLGATFSWNITLQKASGEALNPSYFVNDI